jgi:NAD+ kinase
MSDGPVVGIVGAADGAIRSAVEAAGGRPESGEATAVARDSDYVVAVGEPALLAVARAGPRGPVLPVGAGPGVGSAPGDGGPAAVERLLAGEFDREDHPILEVRVADRTRARVLMDAMLVTASPGEISEYAAHADGTLLSRFRADGVVVATPAGSAGYARRAGGPVVQPGAGVATVVPVGPFATDASHWVVASSTLSLSVERDETPVSLLADDRVVGSVHPQERVRLVSGEPITVAVVPGHTPRFDV